MSEIGKAFLLGCAILAIWLLAVFQAHAGYIVGGDIPPKRYDHKYRGKVVIKYVDEEPGLLAFTYGDTGGICVIYVNRRPGIRLPLHIILRHELGHCAGWPANHRR